tara:strand:- start:328 stop:720 length:393 start_codon:yes stop_codon:yes gene_type:complete
MPHLQFDFNKKLKDSQKEKFIQFVKETFADVMQTGEGHIAISIREFPKISLNLGRVKIGEQVCLMNFDIREGRTKEQKRKFVRTIMQEVEKTFEIKLNNQYATYSSHPAVDFNLYEKFLKNWVKKDNPAG